MRKNHAGSYDLTTLLSYTEASEGGCMVWTRARMPQGYPVAQHKGKLVRAHRLAYELATGSDISGQVIHHTCANRSCINPAHLQAASQADNVLEMMARKDYEARITALEARVAQLEAELDIERQVTA